MDTLAAVYILKLELLGSSPPIWRRLQVPVDIELSKLHDVLQIVMGWSGAFRHAFTIGGIGYESSEGHNNASTPESDTSLGNALNGAGEFIYMYDFEDRWQHRAVVESVQEMEALSSFPLCLDGGRACPPERVGGIDGYMHLLEVITDPGSDEYANATRWMGRAFTPESYDVGRVNRALGGLLFDAYKQT